MLPTLATIERVLAICAGDVKIMTWVGVFASKRMTPGTTRKLTVAVSITVDWRVVM
jgi:hypothetical protein